MHLGLSWRGVAQFLILELLLLGLLALTGQVPWWLWFVASALLFAALWAYDHKIHLAFLARRATPTQMAAAVLTTMALCMLSGGALTIALLWPSRPSDTKEVAAQPKSPPAGPKSDAFNQSLLAVVSVATEKRHNPLRLEVTLANTGRLPTLKAYIGMDVIISEADPPALDRIAKLFDEHAPRATKMGQFTLAPGQIFQLTLWHEGVTKEVFDDYMAGKKLIFVALVADYTDPATPEGKRRVMEFVIRPANPRSGVEDPMKNWSLLRQRSYLLE